MKRKAPASPTRSAGARYKFRLYVTGMTPRSQEAVHNLRALCAEHLPDRHDLEIVDIYESPHSASQDQIVAVPTLVKLSPGPVRRLIGNLSDRRQVLATLELQD